MSERIYPIEYKGKTIYYSDWRNLKTSEDAIRVMNETADVVEKWEKPTCLNCWIQKVHMLLQRCF